MARKSLIFLLIMCIPVMASAQSSNSTPYSFFGIGDRVQSGYSVSRLMGGAGVASGSKGFVNNMNPASLWSLDSLDVLFDVGLDVGINQLSSQGNSANTKFGNINYLAVGFKPVNFWGLSVGINPYSTTNYSIVENNYLPYGDLAYQKNFSGTGGLSTFYMMNSFSLGEMISLGIRTSYIFGSQDITEEIVPQENLSIYTIKESRFINSLYLDYGINLHKKLGNNFLALGFTFGNSKKLNYRSESIIYGGGDTLDMSETTNNNLNLPANYGVGFSFTLHDRLMLSTDYKFEKWSKYSHTFATIEVRDQERYSMGLKYFVRAKNTIRTEPLFSLYLGGFYEKSYMKLYGNPLDSYGANIGFEIPIRRGMNYVRAGYSYKQSGTKNDGLFLIDTHSINLSVTLKDKWFYKRKFD